MISPPKKRFRPAVSWRSDPSDRLSDPSDRLSDWTIEITNEEDDVVTIYYVHLLIVGAGQWSSEHFQQFLEMKQPVEEVQGSTSEISLQGSAARAFPEMLNHMYTGECNLSGENALAMLFLAKRFLIPTLHAAVVEFIKEDTSPSSVSFYLSEVRLFRDDKMVKMVKRVYSRHLIKLTDVQICSLNPEKLKKVIASEDCSSIDLRRSLHGICLIDQRN